MCLTCQVCQQVKAEHKRPGGLLESISIPEWKWEHITMDMVTGLPRSPARHDSVWVLVDHLTKTARFITVHTSFTTSQLAQKFIHEIVWYHRVPVSIISDRGSIFTSRY